EGYFQGAASTPEIRNPWVLLLSFENKRRRQAGRSRKPGRRAPGEPTRAALNLPQISLRIHIHPHLAELQAPVAFDRKHRPRRLHLLLHNVWRTQRLPQSALPAALVHLPSEERALAGVLVIRLQNQAVAMLEYVFLELDRL